MPDLELEQVVLDGPKVHIDPFADPIFADGRHWKIELRVTVGAVRLSLDRIVSHPFSMIDAIEQLALTLRGMLYEILTASGLASKLVRDNSSSVKAP